MRAFYERERGAAPGDLNGVEQREGVDFVVRDCKLVFESELAQEKLGVGRWTSMVLGIAGSYGKDDAVDVVYERNGRPAVASKLRFEQLD